MSIYIEKLTKTFGVQTAVNEISFEARKGEVLGFLGPNGAGKSTTMKIITGYLAKTSGTVQVSGYDVASNPMLIKQKIGYLPEHNPLYKDLYVKEYLGFVAGLHGIKKSKIKVAEMIERTGLNREQNKKISALSKGYRQRVGLAQAMLHDPEVLILDEPTSGLDPNQLVDIRKLIKDLAAEKTVIFSTHIMQEVQALCNRVAIIDRGNIVANAPIADLQQQLQSQKTTILLELLEKANLDSISKLEGVLSIESKDGKTWEIVTNNKKDLRPQLFQACVDNAWTLIGLRQQSVSMEHIFQQLTMPSSPKKEEELH